MHEVRNQMCGYYSRIKEIGNQTEILSLLKKLANKKSEFSSFLFKLRFFDVSQTEELLYFKELVDLVKNDEENLVALDINSVHREFSYSDKTRSTHFYEQFKTN